MPFAETQAQSCERTRLQLLSVLTCAEVHAELIAAAEVAGEEAFGRRGLALFVLQAIRVRGTLSHSANPSREVEAGVNDKRLVITGSLQRLSIISRSDTLRAQ